MTGRHLSRCEVCSLLGEDAADQMFGCTMSDLDPDSLGDMIALEGIARDKEKCAGCGEGRSEKPLETAVSKGFHINAV